MFAYTKPHARLRNWLVFLVLLRAVQLPVVTWATAAVISGPVAQRDAARRRARDVLGFVALVADHRVLLRVPLALRALARRGGRPRLRNELYAHSCACRSASSRGRR